MAKNIVTDALVYEFNTFFGEYSWVYTAYYHYPSVKGRASYRSYVKPTKRTMRKLAKRAKRNYHGNTRLR